MQVLHAIGESYEKSSVESQQRFLSDKLLVAGIGCLGLLVLLAAAVYLVFLLFPTGTSIGTVSETAVPTSTIDPHMLATQEVIPTLAAVSGDGTPPAMSGELPASLTGLYEQVNPGVVNIQVYIERNGLSGEGAGSGFILDNEGHIVTSELPISKEDGLLVSARQPEWTTPTQVLHSLRQR